MLRIILPIATAALSITAILFQVGFANFALAIAEPLIPINTGNANLDNNIPKFFSCIKKQLNKTWMYKIHTLNMNLQKMKLSNAIMIL